MNLENNTANLNTNGSTVKSKIGRNPFSIKKPKNLSSKTEASSDKNSLETSRYASTEENFQWNNSEHIITYAFAKIPYNALERIAWGACFSYAVFTTFLGKDKK